MKNPQLQYFIERNLIYTLLRSEKNTHEDNYLKYINNATDSEFHQRINNIRIQTAKIGNLLSKEERNTIRKELYRLEYQERITRKQREGVIAYLIN